MAAFGKKSIVMNFRSKLLRSSIFSCNSIPHFVCRWQVFGLPGVTGVLAANNVITEFKREAEIARRLTFLV